MLILEQIPMRQDNYSYVIIKDDHVIMIDPSEEIESLAFFKERPHLKLSAILNTHSHVDHVGGNDALWKIWHCPVFGPKAESDRIPHCNNMLVGGENLTILDLPIYAYDVKAHTIGHTAFLVDHAFSKVIKHGHGHAPYIASNLAGHKVLFVGDSLFAAGCGRLFEGTTQNLADALSFYAQQEPNILMACAHEYTAANLRFAKEIFSQNSDIDNRSKGIEALLKREGASVPCFFGDEHKTNPFLLAVDTERNSIAQRYAVNPNDLPAVVGALRHAKDIFQ
jgi:hydroxyacylglutathione hydrolase